MNDLRITWRATMADGIEVCASVAVGDDRVYAVEMISQTELELAAQPTRFYSRLADLVTAAVERAVKAVHAAAEGK